MATLREIQLCQLDILKAVVEICDRHDIPYYLAYGTLLGAVRHKGFIPWDDDVDIYMKYDDLKRFKQMCKKELPEKYFYQDPDTDIASHWLFAKIRANGTCMSESFTANGTHADYHEGVWIDIFPMLDAADTPEGINKQLSSLFEYQHNLFFKQPIKKDMSTPAKLITLLTNIKGGILLRRKRKIFEHLQSKNSGFSIVLGNFFFDEDTESNRKKALTDIVCHDLLVPVKYSFEDSEFFGFRDYDRYLSNKYGNDYMTPKKWSHISDYDHVTV